MDGLAGFGLSISAADLDSNGYPDLVIGSYLSDRAVILRSVVLIQCTRCLKVIDLEVNHWVPSKLP